MQTLQDSRRSSSRAAPRAWAARPRKPSSTPAATSVLLDVNAEAGAAAEQSIGAQVRFAQADVTSEEQVKAAIDLAVSTFGNLYGVVNAAGIGPAAKVLGKNGPHALDLFEKTIRVNLVGTFNVIRLAAAVMAQNAPPRRASAA